MNRRNLIRVVLILLAALVMLLGGLKQPTRADWPTRTEQGGHPGGSTPTPTPTSGSIQPYGSSGGWG